jgi:hypothetical protein
MLKAVGCRPSFGIPLETDSRLVFPYPRSLRAEHRKASLAQISCRL